MNRTKMQKMIKNRNNNDNNNNNNILRSRKLFVHDLSETVG